MKFKKIKVDDNTVYCCIELDKMAFGKNMQFLKIGTFEDGDFLLNRFVGKYSQIFDDYNYEAMNVKEFSTQIKRFDCRGFGV